LGTRAHELHSTPDRESGSRGVRRFFFFQAEDGIRDGHVTGVQTCALPISPEMPMKLMARTAKARDPTASVSAPPRIGPMMRPDRSEERRVGKEWRSRGSPYH